MDFSELVLNRYSCRKYLDKKVPRDLIDQCLETARIAPSACNSQPWEFIVVDDQEKVTKIVKETMSGIYNSNSFVKTAPALIVVKRIKSTYIARLGGMIRDIKYSLIDVGIACEHIVLKATELGLGTCWLGWFNENKLKKILNLKKSCNIEIIISIGYPDPSVKAPQKIRKSLDNTRIYLK